MDANKQQSLDETYEKFMDIGLSIDLSIDILDQLTDKKIFTGFNSSKPEADIIEIVRQNKFLR